MRAYIIAAMMFLAAGGAEAQANGEGAVCGGMTGARCGAGEYCDYPPDAMCGIADATGICRARPDLCTLDLRPVCGCDGETYPNACAAHVAGVSLAAAGPCGGEVPAQ